MPRNCLNSSRQGKEALIADAVTIITEGSPKIGFGHLRRSITLAQEISSRSPVHLWLLGAERPEDVSTDVCSHLQGLTWSSGAKPEVSHSSVWILDLEEDSQRKLLRADASKTKRLALDWFDSSILPDKTVNLLDHSGRMGGAYSSAGRPDDYHEGPDYAIIRPGLLALRSTSTTASGQVRRVVITPGGADPARRGLEALQLLKTHGHSNLEIVLIIGPLVLASYEQELRAIAPASATVLRNPPDFDRQLAAADVVLCSGGGTLLEALALGKSAVVLPQTAAEESHARSHADAGACIFAEDLAKILDDGDFRGSLERNARQRVDGRGTQRIADLALSLRATPDSP